MTEIAEMVRELGALGLVVFLVWYDRTKMIPGIIKRFQEQNTAQADTFSESLKVQRDDFKDAISQQRSDFLAADIDRRKGG